MNTNMQESAQELLNHYVRIQGLNVSQVIFFLKIVGEFINVGFLGGGRCCVRALKHAIGFTQLNQELWELLWKELLRT